MCGIIGPRMDSVTLLSHRSVMFATLLRTNLSSQDLGEDILWAAIKEQFNAFLADAPSEEQLAEVTDWLDGVIHDMVRRVH